MAITQHRETIEVPAGRGTIYDRTGEPLAIGEQATTVFADPRNIADAQRAAVVAGKTLGLDADALYPTLKDRSKGFVYVARKADPVKAEALEQARDRRARVLPRGAARVPAGRGRRRTSLGFAGTDNHGLDGLERSLDKTLAGRPGVRDDRQGPVRPRDRRRHVARGAAGAERDADDRPSDPGERRADPRAHREAVRCPGRRRDRDGSAYRARSSRWRTTRPSTPTRSRRRPRRATQPRRHGRLRARARRSRS